jgi:hypothetical protein
MMLYPRRSSFYPAKQDSPRLGHALLRGRAAPGRNLPWGKLGDGNHQPSPAYQGEVKRLAWPSKPSHRENSRNVPCRSHEFLIFLMRTSRFLDAINDRVSIGLWNDSQTGGARPWGLACATGHERWR